MNVESLAQALRAAAGDDAVLVDADRRAPYLAEWRGRYRGLAPIVVRPDDVEGVSRVVRCCAERRVGIVPQGGNTGLVGGAVSGAAEIVLSLDRLARVRTVDAVDGTLSVDAGITLANAQAAAAEVGMMLPLSLSAEGSCQVGGNLATNAGGVNVLRYGNAREQLLGIEVVLADGRILDAMNTLKKNNAGYKLPQLFSGSEGTLGIITGAVLKLVPEPAQRNVLWLTVPDLDAVLASFQSLRRAFPSTLAACELIPDIALDFVLRHVSDTQRPGQGAWHMLVEVHGGRGELDAGRVAAEVEHLLETALVEDAAVAQSSRDQQRLWKLRHSISEAQRHEGVSLKHDVAVPLSALPDFVRRVDSGARGIVPGIRPVCFGHVGDGNLHVNFSQPADMAPDRFRRAGEQVSAMVYAEVAAVHGTVSAEHGIGLLKRDLLKRQVGGVAVDVMRRLKAALDPSGIMNPGKLL